MLCSHRVVDLCLNMADSQVFCLASFPLNKLLSAPSCERIVRPFPPGLSGSIGVSANFLTSQGPWLLYCRDAGLIPEGALRLPPYLARQHYLSVIGVVS